MINHIRLASTLLTLLLLGVAAPAASAQTSFYADPKAHATGDMLTIILAEQTAAQRESNWQNKTNASTSASGNLSSGTGTNGTFGMDASFDKQALARNASTQSDLLHGTITATVVSVDSTGNLLIRGERKLNVNGETHVMRVSGKVRPFDIRYDNTVLSYQIAGANIEYRQTGFGRKFFRPGALVRWGLVGLLGGAAFAAMSAK